MAEEGESTNAATGPNEVLTRNEQIFSSFGDSSVPDERVSELTGITEHSGVTFSLPDILTGSLSFDFSNISLIVSGCQLSELETLNGVYVCKGKHQQFPKFVQQNGQAIIFCGPGLEAKKWAWKLNHRNRTDSYEYISPSFPSAQAQQVLTNGADWTHLYMESTTIHVAVFCKENQKEDDEAHLFCIADQLHRRRERQSLRASFSGKLVAEYCVESLQKLCQGKTLKIAILGGGIYGCHIALLLGRAGFQVTLFEKEDHLFAGASGNSAFRIHKGYHYPRSQKTRNLCVADHIKFLQSYGHLVEQDYDTIEKVFLISQDGQSHIDFGTMEHVMRGARLSMGHVDYKQLGFENVEGGFIGTGEPILYADYPRQWFAQQLKEAGVDVQLGQKVDEINPGVTSCAHAKDVPRLNIQGQEFDFCINCTYNQSFATRLNDYEFWYEVCAFPVAVLRQGQDPLSFGVFDGPFPSIEPYIFKGELPERFKQYQGRPLYQIWHVKDIVWKRFQNADDAWALVKEGIPPDEFWNSESFSHTMMAVRKFFPKFDERYEIITFNTAIKTMVSSCSSSRPLVVVNDVDVHPFFFTVFSAKLSTVFSCAEAVLLGMVKAVASGRPDGEDILDGEDSIGDKSRVGSLKRQLKRAASDKRLLQPRETVTVPQKSNSIERGKFSKSVCLASFEEDIFDIFGHGEEELSSSDEEDSVGDLATNDPFVALKRISHISNASTITEFPFEGS